MERQDKQRRVSAHGKGLGVPDKEAVERRAVEIALSEGREASEVNQNDRDLALQELQGQRLGKPDDVKQSADVAEEQESRDPSEPKPVSGDRQEQLNEADENEVMRDVVEEGVDEADHEHRVQARKDQDRERGT